ncbi:unnamed protein product [Linum trigynum]|uniref:Uncharacterized protein n=1 Tax=Linum trigynum TaxID=586398 RepID=A0AAV2CQY3_9ROSI
MWSVFFRERAWRPQDQAAIQRRTACHLSDPRHGSKTAADRCGQRLDPRRTHREGVVSGRAKLPDRPWMVWSE